MSTESALDAWVNGGWRRSGAPRNWDSAVADLAELYDVCVARAGGGQRQARPEAARFRRTESGQTFARVLRFLSARGVDPKLYLAAVFSTPWGTNPRGYPYPSQLVCEAAWSRWLRWSANIGRRYQYEAPAGAQAEAAAVAEPPEAALRRVLDDGLAQYTRLAFKDVPRLVLLAPGALPAEFALAWPAVRRAAAAGTAPTEITATWARLQAVPGLVRYLDTWAQAAGLPLEE